MGEKEIIQSTSYIFGLLSIIFAFFSPFVGLVIGIIGAIFSKKDSSKISKKSFRLNITGIILSIIFLLITFILFYFFGNSLAQIQTANLK